MPRKWTREERKRHVKEKYRDPSQKIFAMIVAVVLLVIVFGFAATGILTDAISQVVLILIIGLSIVTVFFINYGWSRNFAISFILAIIVLIILSEFLLFFSISSIAGFIAAIFTGIAIVALIYVLAFFIDLYMWEGQ
jgi:hypothetical protein